MYHPMIL